MLRRAANSLLGTSRQEAPVEEALSETALLRQWQQGVDCATMQAFVGSSELPTGAESERESLLLRYIRAEKLSLAKAAQRLEQQAAWRLGFGAVGEDDVAAELASAKCKLQPPTAGSSFRPLLIVKASRHRPGATPQCLNQFIFFCLEAASHYCWDPRSPDGKLIAVFDLAGLQLKNLDATALRASFHMLADHFPERMAAVFMVDAPAIFFGIWKLVEPFIDKTARKNIHFVSGKAAHEALLEALGPEILPVEYGGTAAEVPVEVAAKKVDAWRQQHLQQQQQGQTAVAAVVAVEQPAAADMQLQQHVESLARHTGSLRLSESTSELAAVA